jgi:PAS domain S-box-containing protein
MAELNFRAVVDAMPEVLAVFDRDHRYVYVNAAFESTTGVQASALLGRLNDEVMQPDDAASWRIALAAVLSTGNPAQIEYTLGGSGERRHFAATLARLPNDLVCALCRDITDVRDQKEQLELAIDRAREADRRKDELLAMLSHELRNPLAPIATALELMEIKDGAGARKEREVIRRQVDHLSRLIDDLLDVSRITRGKIELECQVVEIATVIAKAVELASPLFDKRLQRLSIDVPRTGLLVNADPRRLAQVFQNLLTNASKYSDQRTVVELRARGDGERVVVELHDHGIGIPPDLMPRLFDLFAQGQRALDRSEGGLGIGLAVAKSLCELHGGTILVTSPGAGRGSTFIVSLPHVKVVSATPNATSSARPTERMPAIPSGTRVLVVDDNVDAAHMLRDFLQALGHEPAIAHDGQAALELASSFKPDIAVLDIGLPVMNGYELARRLREQLGPDKLRLIAVTGYGQDSDRARAAEVGFDHHLIKPIELDALLSLLGK